MMNPFDLALFFAMNGIALSWVGAAALVFSDRLLGIAAVAVVLGWLLLRRRALLWRGVWALALAVALADGLGARVLKPLIGRVRPCFALPAESVHVMDRVANVGSMPSLHAANSFAVALVVTLLDRRLAVVAYPLAALVAASRVVLGVHWPTDVLGGAAFGTVTGLCAWWLVDRGLVRLSRHRQRRSSSSPSSP